MHRMGVTMADGCRAFSQTVEWGGALLVFAVLAVLVLRGRPHWNGRQAAKQALIVATGLVVYFGVRHLTVGDELPALQHARDLFDFEQALSIAREGAIQDAFGGSLCAFRMLNWVYIWWHWPVILMAAVWLFLWHRPAFYRYRNAMLISGGIGLIVFATYPVAPPRLVPELNLIDTVSEHSTSYRVLQPKAFTAQYAAMPSLHFGWNLLIGVAMVRTGRGLLRAAGVVMPLAMLLAIVATANHFIIDAVAGGTLALLGLVIATHAPPLTARLRAYAARYA
ncbi:MAG: phosphatase PAP2 family protein [Dehalococcoidia bacterium]